MASSPSAPMDGSVERSTVCSAANSPHARSPFKFRRRIFGRSCSLYFIHNAHTIAVSHSIHNYVAPAFRDTDKYFRKTRASHPIPHPTPTFHLIVARHTTKTPRATGHNLYTHHFGLCSRCCHTYIFPET